HLGRHFRLGITNVDLPTGDVILSAIKSNRFGQAGYCMLAGGVRSGVWPRYMGRDRAIVDDPAPSRSLVFHQSKSGLSAKKGAREVYLDDLAPLLNRQILQ